MVENFELRRLAKSEKIPAAEVIAMNKLVRQSILDTLEQDMVQQEVLAQSGRIDFKTYRSPHSAFDRHRVRVLNGEWTWEARPTPIAPPQIMPAGAIEQYDLAQDWWLGGKLARRDAPGEFLYDVHLLNSNWRTGRGWGRRGHPSAINEEHGCQVERKAQTRPN